MKLDKLHEAMNDPEVFSRVTTDRLGLTFETLSKLYKLGQKNKPCQKILNNENMKIVDALRQDYGVSGFHIPVNKQTIKLMDKKEKFINDIKKV